MFKKIAVALLALLVLTAPCLAEETPAATEATATPEATQIPTTQTVVEEDTVLTFDDFSLTVPAGYTLQQTDGLYDKTPFLMIVPPDAEYTLIAPFFNATYHAAASDNVDQLSEEYINTLGAYYAQNMGASSYEVVSYETGDMSGHPYADYTIRLPMSITDYGDFNVTLRQRYIALGEKGAFVFLSFVENEEDLSFFESTYDSFTFAE